MPAVYMHFKPCGVITLTTDFGLRDPFVAVVKGRILTRFPAARIIDLTHEITAYWAGEAGFWIERAWQYFPDGTVHVAVVDPGVGTRREIIAVLLQQHLFLAPDNGLLAPLIAASPEAQTRRLDSKVLQRLGLDAPSSTFHGRDIFAPIAAELAAGRYQPVDLGPLITEYAPGWIDEPQIIGRAVQGVVVTVDRFGNLITNISDRLRRRFTQPIVHAGSLRLAIRRTYGDVNPGEYLALINAFGVIEIARAEGSAAESLGLGRGAPVSLIEGVRSSH